MSTENRLERLEVGIDTLVARHDAARAAVDLGTYRGRILAFASEVLGVGALTDPQKEHLAVAMNAPRSAAYGANGCGKTFDDAIIALYLIYVENYLVIATSAKESQLRDQYMRDIRRLFLRAEGLPGELYTMQLRRTDNPESGLMCMAAGAPDNLRSFHAPRVAVQLQEAQGLPDFAFESAEMMAVGSHDKVTLTGNTTQVGGEFHRRCQSPAWVTVRFNAAEHPNVIEGRVVVPGGPTRESIAQRAADYGIESAFYIASVLGLFPDDSIDGLIQRSWMLRAFDLHDSGALREESEWAPVVLGLDVARRGHDLNALAVVRGAIVEELLTWHEPDMTKTADLVVEHARRWTLPSQERRHTELRRPHLVVDGNGVGGMMVDELRKRGWGVTDYNGGEQPVLHHLNKHLNRRAETHWCFRGLVEQGKVALPRDEKLLEEALAQEYTITSKGLVQLVAKDDIREKLKRSPDRLDAVVMALAQGIGGVRYQTITCSMGGW